MQSGASASNDKIVSVLHAQLKRVHGRLARTEALLRDEEETRYGALVWATPSASEADVERLETPGKDGAMRAAVDEASTSGTSTPSTPAAAQAKKPKRSEDGGDEGAAALASCRDR